MPLDEWQEQALEAAMGERSDGRWASKFVGVSAPRQNGKSQLIVARALAGVLLFEEKMIIISAHETDTAREIWKRLIDVIEDNPNLEGRVTGRMDAINREFLAFGKGADKQTIKLKARRQSGSRGFSADCLLLDEAQMLGKPAWGSIVPTMSARPNPQLWLFGTPPTESDDPFAFSRVRESSMAKKARHCWLEWAADPTDDFDDPETWAKANPSYGVRISYEACADDRSAMDDDQFAMERLGMWSDSRRVSLFEGTTWADGKRDERPDGLTVDALALAVSIDLAHSSVVAASVDDGDVWVKPLHHGPGTKGVVDRCVELQSRFDVDVVVDGRGPGAVLIPHLEKAGVRLHIASTGDVLDAFANLETKVKDGQFFHVDAPELDAAAAGAVRRDVGDRSALGRKKSSADISPLEAASLAAWRAGLGVVAVGVPQVHAWPSDDELSEWEGSGL
jgi:phage terminase large subunit-like protein